MLRSLTAHEELELLASCREGDERAWRRLYELAVDDVRLFLRRHNGQAADLDDLCQQVFVEVFSSIERFRNDSRLSTWLYRLSAHVSSRAWRSQSRHRRKLSALAESREGAVYDGLSPANICEARRITDAVDTTVAALTPAHRMVWLLSTIEGLPPHEIATIVDMRVGAVRSRLRDARRLVLEGLARRGVGPGLGLATPEHLKWTSPEEEVS